MAYRDPVRQRGNALGEVICDAGDEGSQIHGIGARRAANALEPVGHPGEAFEIAAHMMNGCADRRIGLAPIFDELQPATETRKGSSQLMGGFPRHPGPDSLAIGASAHAQHVQTGSEDDDQQDRLDYRYEAESLHQPAVTEMHLSNAGLDYRRVLRIEARYVLPDARIVERHIAERQVVERGRLPRRVGDDDWHAECSYVPDEIEQNGGFIAGRRIGQCIEHLRVHLAQPCRVRPQELHDRTRVYDVGAEEQRQDDEEDDDRRSARHPTTGAGPFRDRGTTPRERSPCHPSAEMSREGRR